MRVFFLATAVFLVFGCAGEESEDSSPGSQLRIAEQHGLAYLPLGIMQVTGILDEELARVSAGEAEWIRTGNATMIREAMLSERLDIGFMGIPPFLIGVDRDTGWQLITGLSEAPLGLVTTRRNYESLSDISPQDRIALPQPGSIQHILLAMAAERAFDEPQRFDDQLVSMGHPEGLTALLAGRDVTAQFTSPPYLFQALDHQDATLLLDGKEAFGGRFTFIVGVTAPGWAQKTENSEAREAFLRALDRGIDAARSLQETVRHDPEASPELLRELSSFYDITEARLREQLAYPGMVYTREIVGVERFVERMDRYGYIDADDLPQYRSSPLE
ncbi:MAG: ABC transporter substrate-binding protein [Alkalispirochaeta sp.]